MVKVEVVVVCPMEIPDYFNSPWRNHGGMNVKDMS